MFLLLNENPIGEEHVSWSVRESNVDGALCLTLYEIVRRYYRHPEAPEHATVQVLEEKAIVTLRRTSMDCATLILLEANMKAIDTAFKEFRAPKKFTLPAFSK